MLYTRCHLRRPGVIAPMTAVFSIFLLGMVAFAIDTSWVVLTQSELQNVGDAAALAGAQELVKNYVPYNLPNQSASNQGTLLSNAVANAKTSAKNYASYNGAGGKASVTLLDSDIDIGFTTSAGAYTSYAPGGSYPNTVKVTTRRDGTANQPLSLFFAPVLGTSSLSLTAKATAMVYTGSVNSFKAGNVSIMPMTYDVNAWKNFQATGQDPDGNTTTDANGNPEIQVYPSVKATGNFGQLSLSDSNVGSSTIDSWFRNGTSSADIQALITNNLLPLSNHPANTWDWQGSTGLTTSNINTAINQAGTPFWLPLFQPYNSSSSNYQPGVGTGSNFAYDIVAFVPVVIVDIKGGGHAVVVQPTTLLDGNAIFDPSTIVAAGNATTYSATVMAPKLSR